jgi:hypothetical protein
VKVCLETRRRINIIVSSHVGRFSLTSGPQLPSFIMCMARQLSCWMKQKRFAVVRLLTTEHFAWVVCSCWLINDKCQWVNIIIEMITHLPNSRHVLLCKTVMLLHAIDSTIDAICSYCWDPANHRAVYRIFSATWIVYSSRCMHTAFQQIRSTLSASGFTA